MYPFKVDFRAVDSLNFDASSYRIFLQRNWHSNHSTRQLHRTLALLALKRDSYRSIRLCDHYSLFVKSNTDGRDMMSGEMRHIDKCSISSISSGLTESVTEKPRTLKLRRSDSGYGFYLKKTTDNPMHVICDVEDGSVAQNSGLRNDDILACVNGEDIMRASHEECVRKIKDSGDYVELTVASRSVMKMFYQHGITASSADQDSWLCLDDATLSYTNLAFEDVPQIQTNFSSVHNTPNTINKVENGNINSAIKQKDVSLPSYPNRQLSTDSFKSSETCADSLFSTPSSPPPQRLCDIIKSNEDYGFQLDYEEKTDNHTISKVEPNSPADKSGLRDGDRILEVNGASVVDKTHQGVVDLISQQKNQVSLLVISDEITWKNLEIKSKAKEDFYRRISSYADSVHECYLSKKPGEEFEFFLMVDHARNAQVISDVTPGGPADRCGLKNGDTLIEVNGINVENKPHKDVVKMIKDNVTNNQIRFLVSGEKRTLFHDKRKESCAIS